MNVLGLQFGHDAGAVVLRNGRVAAYILRERLSRVKHALSLDPPTITAALADAGLEIGDIDYCAITSTQKIELIGHDPRRIAVSLDAHPGHTAPCSFADVIRRGNIDINKMLFGFVLDLLYRNKQEDLARHSVSSFFPEFRTLPEAAFSSHGWLDTYITAGPWGAARTLADLGKADCGQFVQTDVLRHGFHYPATITIDGRPIAAYFINHHMAHAASIYYPSGLRRAAILTHDGFGGGRSYHSGMYYFGDEHRIYPLAPHHLLAGAIYESAGIRLNLGLIGPAGKLMGLAPYGRPKFPTNAFVGNWFDLAARGLKTPGDDWVRHCLSQADRLGYDLRPFRDRAQATAPINADIAASTQRLFEETLLAAAGAFAAILGRLGHRGLPLCYAGGTALNCPANSLLQQQGAFSSIQVPPWCDDSGLALGAALALHHNVFDNPLVEQAGVGIDAYLGGHATDTDIESALQHHAARLTWQNDPDWAETAAQDLAADRVIGWFEGRSEIGPRSLGHRSILADPRKAANWQRVNAIKSREPWRPFAPAVLREHAATWFDGAPDPSPHMLFTAKVLSDAIPAITHVDGSARIQTVDASVGTFFRLLERFHAITDTPVVLNTSFNGPGEPIVETPEDAIRFFLGSPLEVLYLEGRRVLKRETEPA